MRSLDPRKKPQILFLIYSIALFLVPALNLFAEYPVIKQLSNRDILYSQLQKEITQYYQAISRGKLESIPKLKILTVQTDNIASIFSFSSKVNIPYETIATLNRLATSSDFPANSTLLVSNLPGLFIPLNAENDLEEIMQARRSKTGINPQQVTVFLNNKKTEYLFFHGEHFHPIERAFFLRLLFRFPLLKGVKTSSFGYREDPFTGHPSFHGGIDLAAPVGSPVFASGDGKVTFCGYSDILGNYLIITHSNGYETLYGHLKEINVVTGKSVEAGTIIGKVGLTGKTTGPHLHFEIRKKGKHENPESLLRN